MEPLVSIVIPFRNCENTILNLFKSILNLSYKKFEVIVVDSSDDGHDISKFQSKKIKILKIPYKGKQTTNVARNMGLRVAKGSIVAFTDADCIVSKNWLNEIVKTSNSEKIGIIGGSVIGLRNNVFSIFAEESIISLMRKYRKRGIITLENFHKILQPLECNIAIKKSLFKKIGHFDEDASDGLSMYLNSLRKGYKIVYSPDIVVKHDIQINNIFDAIEKYFKYGKSSGMFFKKYPSTLFAKGRLLWATLGLLASISYISLLAMSLENIWILIPSIMIPLIIFIYHLIKIKQIIPAFVFPFLYFLLYGISYPVGFFYSLLNFNTKR